jgi:hypothetical protein
MARLDTCFGRTLGAVGPAATKRFGVGEVLGGNVGAAGSSVASLAARPGRSSGRGQAKSSARPVGALIGAPLSSTRVAIGSAEGDLVEKRIGGAGNEGPNA